MVGKLRKENISTQSELIELVNQEWEKIDKEKIGNWIDSMSGRIIEWIDHDGESIKYLFIFLIFRILIYFCYKNSHFYDPPCISASDCYFRTSRISSFYEWLKDFHLDHLKYINWYWRIIFYKNLIESRNLEEVENKANKINELHIYQESEDRISYASRFLFSVMISFESYNELQRSWLRSLKYKYFKVSAQYSALLSTLNMEVKQYIVFRKAELI